MKQTIPFAPFAVVALMTFSVIGCGGDGGSGGNVANCDDYCAVWAMCTTRDLNACKTDCVEFNEMSIADFSQACGDADAEVNACVAALNCEQLQAWREEVPPESYPCKAADDAADQICNAA